MEVAMSIIRDLAIFARAFTSILIKVSTKENLLTLSFLGEVIMALGSAQQLTKKIEDDSVGKSLSDAHQYFKSSKEGGDSTLWGDAFSFLQRTLFKSICDLKIFLDSVQSTTQMVQNIASQNDKEEVDGQINQLSPSTLYLSSTASTTTEEPKQTTPTVAPYAHTIEEKISENLFSSPEVLEVKIDSDTAGRYANKAQNNEDVILIEDPSSALLRTAEQTSYHTAYGHTRASEQHKPSGTIMAAATVGLMAGAGTVNTNNIPSPKIAKEGSAHLERPTVQELWAVSKPPVEGGTVVKDLSLLSGNNGDKNGGDMLSGMLGLGSEKLTISNANSGALIDGSIPMTDGDSAGVFSTEFGLDSIDMIDAADGCGCSPSDLAEICLPICSIL
jgi:hypothetical protein